ncbi:MAG: phosphoribosyl-AMP cyclohydrolase [Candidatus Margulisiibacteriota bacterium]
MNSLEEGADLRLDFSKLAPTNNPDQQVIPVVVQHALTKDVLIVAYTNALAFEKTRQTGLATFWSTSRNELWVKGATSGDTLSVADIRLNCEQNALLYLVLPQGQGACHTQTQAGKHRSTCFYRTLQNDALENIEP